jgi:large conductance mechanosensitive channel
MGVLLGALGRRQKLQSLVLGQSRILADKQRCSHVCVQACSLNTTKVLARAAYAAILPTGGSELFEVVSAPQVDQAGVENMSFGSEFKEFAMKGNVVDLAVGVIIGGAFGKIVDSVVADLIMPFVGVLFGGLDFSNYFIPLAGQTATTLVEAKKAGAVFAYGSFITVALNFVILAFIIFMMIKQINRMKKSEAAAPAEPAAPAPTPEDVLLLREIRDALAKR